MDWMSNLFVVLFLTSITGAIFYLTGMIFKVLWFKNDVKLLRFQMEAAQCAFIVPFVYGVLYLRSWTGRQTAGGGNNLFYSTPMMRRVCAALGCIWIVLFIGLLIYKVYVRISWMMVFRGNIPEEDAGTAAMFEEICEQMGISGKVSLYRNDSVEIPCITYAQGFAVVLPLKCYTEKETAVILYHELCHYLSGDIYLKTVSCIVALLHVVNPAAHILLKQLSLVCEECCDRVACEKGAGRFSRSEYFLTILDALGGEEKRERYNLFLLADTTGDYERRVQSMRAYRAHGGFRKGTAVVLSACFLLGSSMTALAAGAGITEAYGKAAAVTADKAEEEIDTVDVVEAEMPLSDEELLEEFARAYDLDPDDVIIIGEEGIETVGDSIYIDWKVPAGKTYMTTSFHRDSGDKVRAMTSGDPEDMKYQMGIKDPNDLMRYVEGSGTMSHEFDVSITGRYCFFVINLGNKELHVKGSTY